jgi:hypothetical protein
VLASENMVVDHGRNTLLYVCHERQKSGKSRMRVILCANIPARCDIVTGKDRNCLNPEGVLRARSAGDRGVTEKGGGVVRLIKRALKALVLS